MGPYLVSSNREILTINASDKKYTALVKKNDLKLKDLRIKHNDVDFLKYAEKMSNGVLKVTNSEKRENYCQPQDSLNVNGEFCNTPLKALLTNKISLCHNCREH